MMYFHIIVDTAAKDFHAVNISQLEFLQVSRYFLLQDGNSHLHLSRLFICVFIILCIYV